jgi:hypothetical protein
MASQIGFSAMALGTTAEAIVSHVGGGITYCSLLSVRPSKFREQSCVQDCSLEIILHI